MNILIHWSIVQHELLCLRAMFCGQLKGSGKGQRGNHCWKGTQESSSGRRGWVLRWQDWSADLLQSLRNQAWRWRQPTLQWRHSDEVPRREWGAWGRNTDNRHTHYIHQETLSSKEGQFHFTPLYVNYTLFDPLLLSISFSACLSVCLSVCLSICVFVCLSVIGYPLIVRIHRHKD